MPLRFSVEEQLEFSNHLSEITSHWDKERQTVSRALQIRFDSINVRLQKLTDAYLDDLVDRPTFEQRKAALAVERQSISNEIEKIAHGTDGIQVKNVAEYIGLAQRAYSLYENGNLEEKQQLLRLITSERVVDCKTPMFTMLPVFQELANRQKKISGAALREIDRDVGALVARIMPLVSNDALKLDW